MGTRLTTMPPLLEELAVWMCAMVAFTAPVQRRASQACRCSGVRAMRKGGVVW